MSTTTIIVLILVIVALAAGLYIFERRRTRRVKDRFGPEYDHVVKEGATPRHAVAILAEREQRVEKYRIRALTPEECIAFITRWKSVQEHFVDDPKDAVLEADVLVHEALQAKGYPMGDFEKQAADLSVNHARVVDEYRMAHHIATGGRQGQFSTEDLRIAMQHYRNLFEEISETHVVPEVHR